jgi:RNAse (barnase) inhibitor barstar
VTEFREIVIDGMGWASIVDFSNALKLFLRSPPWHGDSIDAFIDSIVYGSMNEIEAPFRIKLVNAHGWPEELRRQVREYIDCISDAAAREGRLSEIFFEVIS